MNGVKSKSRGEVTELMHIAPVRAGMIPTKRLRYADRLRVVLEAFNRREELGFPNVIRLFGGIHFAKWALIDGDTRLVLSVVFDGRWEDYLRTLARDTPALLHLIWSNCDGWRPLYGDDENPQVIAPPGKLTAAQERLAGERFMEFVRAYQVETQFLYAHEPLRTAKDGECQEILQRGPRPEAMAALVHALEPRTRGNRLSNALQDYDKGRGGWGPTPAGQLARVKQEFIAVFGALYERDELIAAGTEAFGEGFGGDL